MSQKNMGIAKRNLECPKRTWVLPKETKCREDFGREKEYNYNKIKENKTRLSS